MESERVPAGISADLPETVGRLRGLLVERDLDQVVLRDPASLAWLLGGRVHVPQTLDTACLDVVVDRSGALTVVTNAIEAPRLRDTELAGIDADWSVLPWWGARDDALPTGDRTGADRPYADVVALTRDLAALRRTLTARQAELLRAVGRDAAAAATAATAVINPRTSEYAAAAALASALLERALDPVVLLVAGHDRIAAHRHPLPTTAPLGRRAMLVCCARRHGLIASVTRIVAFEPLTAGERDAYDRLLAVEAAFLDATRPGVRIGDAFAAGVAAYAANGFDALEWHRHHQGGFSGWQPREYPAHHASADVVQEGSVVAWNPSGAGWKVEDTCLVTPGGPVPLVLDDTWPTLDVAGRVRPAVLEQT